MGNKKWVLYSIFFILFIQVNIFATPYSISNLTAISGVSDAEISLSWTSPGNDSLINSGYLIKYSTFQITTNNFYSENISTYTISFVPLNAGGQESMVLTGLEEKTTYFFAIKAYDTNNNFGYWTTETVNQVNYCYSPPNISPAPVSFISVVPGVKIVTLSWTSPGDDGTTGNIINGSFLIKYNNSAEITSLNWDTPDNFSIIINTNSVFNEIITCIITGLNLNSTYYFGIKVRDERPDNFSSLDLTNPRPKAIPYNTVPSTFNLTSPIPPVSRSDNLPGSVTFKWEMINNTDPGDYIYYRLFYSDKSDFNPFIEVSNISGSSYVISGLSDNTTYYWKVYAFDSQGLGRFSNQTDWKIWINTIGDPPVNFNLIRPLNNSTTNTIYPDFGWFHSYDPDPGNSVYYNLYYSTYSNFSTSTTIITGLDNYIPVTKLQNWTTYYWKVDAIDSDGFVTNSNQQNFSFYIDYNAIPSTFSVNFPLLDTVTAYRRPYFSWEVSADEGEIVDYNVKISSDLNFVSGINLNQSQNNFRPVLDLQDNMTYYWTVNAFDSGNNIRQINQGTMKFIINVANDIPGTFNILTPELNKTTNYLKPLFNWNQSIDIDPFDFVLYGVYYSTDSSFNYYNLMSSLTVNQIRPDTDLMDNSTYYLKVISRDNNNGFNITDTVKFFTNVANDSPGNFIILTPLYAATTDSLKPYFSWSESIDPDPMDYLSYELCFAAYSDFFSSSTYILNNQKYFIPSQNFLDNSTYYWKVTVKDSFGTSTATLNSFFIINSSNDLPSPFIILTPVINEIKSSLFVNFSWENSYDSDPGDSICYDLYISTYSSFLFYTSTENLKNNNINLFGPLIDFSTCYWKVIARDLNNGIRESNIGKFYINTYNRAPSTFTLLEPYNSSIINFSTVCFTWEKSFDYDINNSVTYEFQISSTINFSNYFSTAGLVSDSWSLFSMYLLNDNSTYYWRVYATDGSSVTLSKDTYSIFVDTYNSPPEDFSIIEPENGLILSTGTVFFDWTSSSDKDPDDKISYVLLISTDLYLIDQSTGYTVLNTQKKLYDLTDKTVYFWKVLAIDNKGVQKTATPDISSFTININNLSPGYFEIIEPVDKTVVYSPYPVFSWKPSIDPEGEKITYSYYISEDQNFDNIISSRNFMNSSIVLNTALKFNTTYFWKVKAQDEKGSFTWAVNIPYSIYIYNKFSTGYEFNLLAPVNEEVIKSGNISFDWEDSSGVISYTLYYSQEPGFNNFIKVENIQNSYYLLSGKLTDNSTYFWKVTANFINDVVLSSQTYNKFYLNFFNDKPKDFTVTTPLNNSAIMTDKIKFTWEPAVDVDPLDDVTYKLFISTTVIDSIDSILWDYSEIISSITSSEYNLTFNLNENTTYYWKIIASDKFGLKQTSMNYNKFYIPVLSIPMTPTSITLLTDDDGLKIYLAWSEVKLNQDDSLCNDLSGYNIYRSTSLDNINFSLYTFTSTGTLNYNDNFVGRKQFFYMIKAIDYSGQESKDNYIVDSLNTDKFYFYSDTGVNLEFGKKSKEKILSENLIFKIEKSNPDLNNVIYNYKITAFKLEGTDLKPYELTGAVKMEFPYDDKYSDLEKNMNVYFNNGGNLIKIGAITDSGRKKLVSNFSKLGEFKIMRSLQSQNFILNKVVGKKFTPNGDNINDTVNFIFENPKNSEIKGKIISLNGDFVSELKYFENNVYLYWDGKNDKNEPCKKGMYLYTIEGDGKKFTGTIFLVR